MTGFSEMERFNKNREKNECDPFKSNSVLIFPCVKVKTTHRKHQNFAMKVWKIIFTHSKHIPNRIIETSHNRTH